MTPSALSIQVFEQALSGIEAPRCLSCQILANQRTHVTNMLNTSKKVRFHALWWISIVA